MFESTSLLFNVNVLNIFYSKNNLFKLKIITFKYRIL